MRKTVVVIEECDSGWLLTWAKNLDEVYPTAAEALAAVKERDEGLAEIGVNSFTSIDWIPKTKIGRQVVKALQ